MKKTLKKSARSNPSLGDLILAVSSVSRNKREAVAAVKDEYPSGDDARRGIEARLRKFYADKSSDAALAKTISAVQTIYSTNVFPAMKVKWATYPNNIGHNFFIQVSERRREIGIMRAVGATEGDVQMIVLGEAALIGIVGGLLGIGLALGIGTAWNTYADSNIPRFPFKPASWFECKTWIWGSALGFATLFCILGGYLPARRAAKMEPAQALAQN
jgi:hypothetical protein